MRVAFWAARPSGSAHQDLGPCSHCDGVQAHALPAPALPTGSARAGSHVLETQLEQKKNKLEWRPGVLYMSAEAWPERSAICLMRFSVPQGKDSCIPRGT